MANRMSSFTARIACITIAMLREPIRILAVIISIILIKLSPYALFNSFCLASNLTTRHTQMHSVHNLSDNTTCTGHRGGGAK